MESVIIIQNDPAFIQEDGDLARLVACRHSLSKVPDLMSRRVVFRPYMVDNLDVISVPVEDDIGGDRKVDVWIDITSGVFPNTEPLDGPVKVGDNLTLAIYVKDSGNSTDIRIKDCYAYDDIKKARKGIKPAQLQLTQLNGCPLRENLMNVWQRTMNVFNTGATMIAYNNLKAFKFPEKDSVFLACNIDLCRENCTERCEDEPLNPDDELPMRDDQQQEQDQPDQQSLGSDYEDPNSVNDLSNQGLRGSIASNKGKTNQRRGSQQNRQPQQPQQQRPQQQRPQQQRPQQQRPQQQRPQQQRPQQQRPQQQRPQQQRPQQQRPQQQRPPQQRNQPEQPQRRNVPQIQNRQRPQQQRNRSHSPGDFSLSIQHQQSPPLIDFSNSPQNIDQTQDSKQGDLIEQSSSPDQQNSIARPRSSNLRQEKSNKRTIARSSKTTKNGQDLFGPSKQFIPQQLQQQRSPQSQPLHALQPPQQQPSSQQSQPQDLLASQPVQRANNNLPLPIPDSNSNKSQLNELQVAASSEEPKLQKKSVRKVIRKKSKKVTFLDKNNLPLEPLLSSASEIEHSFDEGRHYIPALPIENYNYGARLSKST